MAPWEKLVSVIGVPTPPPTCVLPPPPSDCVTRSENETTVSLKPGVFRFARLLPTTLMAVSSAVSAESAAENDANMICPYCSDGVLRFRRGRRIGRQQGHDLVQIGCALAVFLERGKLRQLGDERRSVRRLGGVLIL